MKDYKINSDSDIQKAILKKEWLRFSDRPLNIVI